MTPESIWASEQLRQNWINSISDKAINIFEKFLRAEDPREPKTKAMHAADAGILIKYIERPLRFLMNLGLLSYEKNGDCFKKDYSLPVTAAPPDDVNWDLWATNKRKNAGFTVKGKRRIYNLDRGVCAYCE